MTDYDPKIASLNNQLAKLKQQIEIEQHRYIRRKNSLKRQLAKERNHRMIFCTGRIEYHLKNRLNIHEPVHECPNPHCHMMTMRPFKEDGTFGEQKSYRRYLLDENGEKILNKKGTDYKFEKVMLYDWDNKENVDKSGCFSFP